MSRNIRMQLQLCLLMSSDPESEFRLMILFATSAFLFIHACQIFKLSFSVDSSLKTRLNSRAEIKLIHDRRPAKRIEDHSEVLNSNIRFILFSFLTLEQPERGLQL